MIFLLALALAAPDHIPHVGDTITFEYGPSTVTGLVIAETKELGKSTQIYTYLQGYDPYSLPDTMAILDCVCDHADAPLLCVTSPAELGSTPPTPRP